MEESTLTQDHVTPLEDITGVRTQFMGLGLDWVTEMDADPLTADANPPTANADPLIAEAGPPIAEGYISFAEYLMPFVDSYS